MTKSLQNFYNAYVEHFETDDEGFQTLVKAIKKGEYDRVNQTMLSAYLLWLDASKSKN